MSSEVTSEELFTEEPIIGGVRCRPYNEALKLKLGRIIRWLSPRPIVDPNISLPVPVPAVDPQVLDEEVIFAFVYLALAPLPRVLAHTRTTIEEYLLDKEDFIGTLTPEELKVMSSWFRHVLDLERRTKFEVVDKPGPIDKETPPPN